MIKRSVPVTFSAYCETSEYAQGMKDGITHTLECLLHECDVIVRISPYVVQLTKEKQDDDRPQKFQVRARFTVREKHPGKIKGDLIKTSHAFYEEEFDDRFDRDREWKGLSEFERIAIRTNHAQLKAVHYDEKKDTDIVTEVVPNWNTLFTAIEAKLKEKNT